MSPERAGFQAGSYSPTIPPGPSIWADVGFFFGHVPLLLIAGGEDDPTWGDSEGVGARIPTGSLTAGPHPHPQGKHSSPKPPRHLHNLGPAHTGRRCVRRLNFAVSSPFLKENAISKDSFLPRASLGTEMSCLRTRPSCKVLRERTACCVLDLNGTSKGQGCALLTHTRSSPGGCCLPGAIHFTRNGVSPSLGRS